MPIGIYLHSTGKNHPNYKGGKPKCLDCGKILSSYDAHRCRFCSDKHKSGINHPFYGRKHSEETRKKISKSKQANPVRYWLGKKLTLHFGDKNCLLCNQIYTPKSGVQLYCQICKKIKLKEWQQKANRSESNRILKRAYFHKDENRPKYQARWHLNKAVRDGKIIKPLNCSKCNNDEYRVEAHHYLGYAPEHRLDIQWLCAKCHKIQHNKL